MIKALTFALSCAAACGGYAQNPLPENDVAAIENSLVPRILVVEGEKAQTFNLTERMQRFNVPGLGVAVFGGNKIIGAKGYG